MREMIRMKIKTQFDKAGRADYTDSTVKSMKGQGYGPRSEFYTLGNVWDPMLYAARECHGTACICVSHLLLSILFLVSQVVIVLFRFLAGLLSCSQISIQCL